MNEKRPLTFLALISALICSVAFYVYKHRQGKTGFFDNIYISSTSKIQSLTRGVLTGGASWFNHYIWLIGTSRKNEELTREVLELKSKMASFSEIQLENERLKNALSFKHSIEHPLIPASIVAFDVSNDFFGVRIDRGKKDGIEVGQGVISSKGAVGRIHRVSESYADVITLLDPNSSIDVVVQRSRVKGIVSGQSRNMRCRMKYVDRLDDVVVDDVLISSGINEIFPKGLLVGYVTNVVSNPSEILQAVSVKPAVDIYKLEEVWVVFPSARKKIS